MFRRLAALAGLVIVLSVGAASAASAHATVVSTSPDDGQVVAAAPSVVSVKFDEPVELQFGALRVFAPSGARVDTGSPGHPTGAADTVQVALAGGLGRGTYTVSWRVISADSHPVSGAFTFSVGAPSATSVSQSTLNASGSGAVGFLYGVARAVAFGAFAVLVGATWFLVFCWPAGAALRRPRIVIASGWAGLVAASLAVLGLQGPYGAGFGLGRVFDRSVLRTTLTTRLGTALSVRLVLLGLAGLALALLLPRLSQASTRLRIIAGTVTVLLAGGMASTWAVSDHAGTGSQVWLAVPVDITHLLAMALWLGGLTVLAAALLHPAVTSAATARPATAKAATLRSATADVGTIPAAVRRFSPLAACCVGVLVVTGTYQAWRQVGTLPALTATTYGKLLLVKLFGVILLIGLGFLARVWIAHYLGRGSAADARVPDARALRQLRGSVALEVLVASGVLALTAVLVDAQPARSAYSVPVSVTEAFNTGGPKGTGSLDVFVDPARTGPNTVHLAVLSPTGDLETVAQLTVTLSLPSHDVGPLPVTMDADGPGHYIGVATIPLTGAWRMAVTVRTDDIDETTVSIPVTVR